MMRLITTLIFCFSSFSYANANQATFAEQLSQAKLNNPRAQYQVSQAFLSGDGVEQSQQEAFYWLEQAALNDYKLAQYDLVEQYLTGGLIEPDLNNAIYWLTKLAIAGDDKAQFELGQLYEKRAEVVDTHLQAKLWYQIAAETNPDAEQAYAQLLEQEFNQRRAKQIAKLQQLDAESTPSKQTNWVTDTLDSNTWALAGLALVLSAGSLGWLRHRGKQRKQHDSNASRASLLELSSAENHKLKTQLSKQDAALKKQRQQIELLYSELKKQQNNTNQTRGVESSANSPLALACAMFGFSQDNIPDVVKIKQRYKQLCKIYHPDLKGSDEEMKRLNHALKVILAQHKK